MIRVIITGAKGRMGQALLQSAARMPDLQVVGGIDIGDDAASAIPKADVVVDFSFHQATPDFAEICAKHKKAMVIGTTGHTESEKKRILACASQIPMVMTSNYSTGVNTLFWLTRKAAEILGPGFDLEVVEMHHRLKKDAPSGTAKRLVEILAEVRNLKYNENAIHGRHGIVGARTDAEIGVHAIR